MVYTVEINDDPYRHSMAATASATKTVNPTSYESKSRKICCQVLGVMIVIIIVAVVTSLSIFYSNHGSKFRKIKYYIYTRPTITSKIVYTYI